MAEKNDIKTTKAKAKTTRRKNGVATTTTRPSRSYPVTELLEKDRLRIVDGITRIGKGVVCDCCELADVFEADRDNVIEHLIALLSHAVQNGTFRNFDVEGGRTGINE